MSPTFFPTQNDFRTWLEDNSENQTELVVGFYKVNSGKASMTWSESVDQALCFGWIDGVRKSLNEEAYTIRFTPRKKNSIWSAINIDKMEQLIQKGLMTEAGLLAYSFRTENKSKIYSHEKEPEVLTEEFELKFQQNQLAWTFFQKQAPSYKKVMIHWIMTAKQEKTRLSRLEKTIQTSELQKRMM
jgi:uncharacterized protein YdeI (YjbR/CyaY-like superfamily)